MPLGPWSNLGEDLCWYPEVFYFKNSLLQGRDLPFLLEKYTVALILKLTGWEDWWFYHALSPPALIPGNSPAQNRAERLGSDNLYTAEAAHTPGTHPVHCPFSNEKSLQAARPLQAVRSRQDLSLPSPPIFTRYSVLYSCYLLLALKTGLLFHFFSLFPALVFQEKKYSPLPS